MATQNDNKVDFNVYVDFTNNISRRTRDIINRTITKLGESIELNYRFVPQQNESAIIAAKAIIAAEYQDKAAAMNDRLFECNYNYTVDEICKIAKNLKLDVSQFKEDLNSRKVAERLKADRKAAEQDGMKITPGISIDGIPYKGAWDEHAILEAVEKRNGRKIKFAIDGFFSWGASAAFVLLIASIAALIFVNVGYGEIYELIRQTSLGFIAAGQPFILSLEAWVNDFLMAIFFLLIGLEIKREIISGELSDIKSAAMPILGALGGMIPPALIYFLFNLNTATIDGWGVPMATDIAFTLGLMALLGNKVPLSLKVFVSALAVADDLGAIVVIALFYGHGFHLDAFLVAAGVLVVMGVLNYLKIYSITPYIILGLILWFFVYESGIHATVAGVLTAALIPFRKDGDVVALADQTSAIFQRETNRIKSDKTNQASASTTAVNRLQIVIDRLKGPGYFLEHSLERGVNYFILPLFAFFNTGILIAGTQIDLTQPVNLGIIMGLCVGKPLGIFGFCWLATKAKIARLSAEINWSMLLGAGFLAGVGFTMSIVVATRAFHGAVLDASKLSILIASTIAATIGLLILKRAVDAQ